MEIKSVGHNSIARVGPLVSRFVWRCKTMFARDDSTGPDRSPGEGGSEICNFIEYTSEPPDAQRAGGISPRTDQAALQHTRLVAMMTVLVVWLWIAGIPLTTKMLLSLHRVLLPVPSIAFAPRSHGPGPTTKRLPHGNRGYHSWSAMQWRGHVVHTVVYNVSNLAKCYDGGWNSDDVSKLTKINFFGV